MCRLSCEKAQEGLAIPCHLQLVNYSLLHYLFRDGSFPQRHVSFRALDSKGIGALVSELRKYYQHTMYARRLLFPDEMGYVQPK